MERQAALSLLDLTDHANETQIHVQFEQKRAHLEDRLAKAPTVALKSKYRAEIARLEQARDVLSQQVAGGSDMGDLPVSQKLDGEDPPPTTDPSTLPGGRRPPSRRTDPPAEPAEASSGRTAPRRRAAEPEPVIAPQFSDHRAPKYPRETSKTDEPDDTLEEEITLKPPREPRSAKALWALSGGVVLVVTALCFAGWKWWYVPSQQAQRAEDGNRSLSSIVTEVSQMPVENELLHAKVRSLCAMAIALGSTGHGSEAGGLVSDAAKLVSSTDLSLTRNEDECRIIAAQAAKGETQAAITALMTLQGEREKAARGGKPAATNAPPLRVPLCEDQARRAIAIAQARQGQPEQAIGMVNGISPSNDGVACEALCEIARQFNAAGNKAQAIQTLQSLETRAKRIPDPVQRAPLLAFVAERMSDLLGNTKAKPFVSEALSGISSGSSSASGYSDMEARKAIAQAVMLPTALRVGSEQKDTYRKKVEDVAALASNLQASTGAIAGQPDFKNRARAYAAVAVAWSELAKHWFSGDAEARAADAIAKAVQAAEQVRPPAQLNDQESALDQKEEALVAVVAALAETQKFEQARKIVGGLVLQENLGPASETLAYHLGLAGKTEEAQELLRAIAAGEARVRAAVGLNYGLNGLPLEKWW